MRVHKSYSHFGIDNGCLNLKRQVQVQNEWKRILFTGKTRPINRIKQ